MMEEEAIVRPTSLDERAAAAKQSEEEAKSLIEEFLPFMKGRVARYSGRLDEYAREDMLSIAMSAFYEAVYSYDVERGHFYSFADRVVCARLIDQVRKHSRLAGKTVSLDSDDDDGEDTRTSLSDMISIRNYEESLRREQLAQEIEQFKSEIAEWGITLEALEKSSPKHSQLRKIYKEIASAVIKSHEITQTIAIKHYFPVSAVVKITGVPAKKIERARVYLIASFIIGTGDYELLSEYIV